MASREKTHSVSEDCVRNAVSGDRQAQKEILENYAGFARGMLYRLTGNRDELDDLFQSVCIEFLQSVGNFKSGSTISTWLGAICINVVRTHYRGRKKWRRSFEETPGDVLPQAHIGSVAAMQAHVMLRKAAETLNVLSLSQRTVLLLRLVYDYSVEEIAEITNSAKSTTQMRLYYARKKFTKALKRDGLTATAADLLPKLEQG